MKEAEIAKAELQVIPYNPASRWYISVIQELKISDKQILIERIYTENKTPAGCIGGI